MSHASEASRPKRTLATSPSVVRLASPCAARRYTCQSHPSMIGIGMPSGDHGGRCRSEFNAPQPHLAGAPCSYLASLSCAGYSNTDQEKLLSTASARDESRLSRRSLLVPLASYALELNFGNLIRGKHAGTASRLMWRAGPVSRFR